MTIVAKSNRRRFMEDVGSGMLLAGLGVILACTEPRVTARQDNLGLGSELQVPSSE